MAYKYIPLNEVTLRKYERPNTTISERDLIKRLCLSIGLLQPGDSRDVIVDILKVLLDAKKNKEMLTSEEIQNKVIEYRKKNSLSDLGIAQSNLRRQLRRMRELFIVEKIKNRYRISEFMDLKELFSEKIERFLIPSIIERIKEHIDMIDESYR